MQFSDMIFFNLGEGFGGVAMMRCGQLLGASQCRGGVAASCLGWWLRPPPKCSRAPTRPTPEWRLVSIARVLFFIRTKKGFAVCVLAV